MTSTVIGTCKLTSGGKMTLIADVRKHLGVKEGDVIVFEKNEKGVVTVRKG